MVQVLSKSKYVYWELNDGISAKFWAASIIKSGNKYTLTRRWGKIGTVGQQMEQVLNDPYLASVALLKLIRSKEREGYKPIF